MERESIRGLVLRLFGALAVMTVVLGLAAEARAEVDELCVSQAVGTPQSPVKHPEWWNPALSADDREARWTGATRIYDNGSVGSDIASGRVIWDKPSARLFFQFEVDGDLSLDATNDIIAFAVSDNTGTFPDLYMHFTPMNDCATTPSTCYGLGKAMSGSSIQYSQASWSGSSITWTPLSTTNPSTAWTVGNPWVELQPGGNSNKWILKFTLTIPTDPVTGEALPNQRFYSNTLMFLQEQTSYTIVEFPLLCKPSPGPSNDCQLVTSGIPTLPNALPTNNMGTIWSHVTTGSTSACRGIDMHRMLVGSDYRMKWGYIPGTSVRYQYPSPWIPYYSGAKLRAGFWNDRDQALNAGDITADFRIANWGLRWRRYTAPTGWNWIASANLDASVSALGFAGAWNEGKIESATWVPQTSGLTFTSPIQTLHVQLTANVGGINFKRDSVYRNMALVKASVFRRPGDIDLGGRELPDGHAAHKVRILERTYHMPSEDECAASGQTLFGCADTGEILLEDEAQYDGGDGGEPKQLPKQPFDQQPQQGMDQPLEQGMQEGFEPLDPGNEVPGGGTVGYPLDELPRYSVHALVDSGNTIDLPGAPGTRIFHEVSSMGYYIEHEGEPSQGFEHYIHVRGSSPVEGLPGVIEVDVPEGQVLAIANTVRIVDGVQTTCLTPPQSHEYMPEQEALAMAEALMPQALDGSLANMMVMDPDFGCQAPPLRDACPEGTCVAHNPISYIEGSKYIGEWNQNEVDGMYAQLENNQQQLLEMDQGIGGFAAGAEASGDEDEEDVGLDGELSDLPDPMQDACCAQASVDPRAGRRGAAKVAGLMAMLLLLRRGRRRRRRD